MGAGAVKYSSTRGRQAHLLRKRRDNRCSAFHVRTFQRIDPSWCGGGGAWGGAFHSSCAFCKPVGRAVLRRTKMPATGLFWCWTFL